MKKMILATLCGVALIATSCDKEGGKCLCSYKVLDVTVEDKEVDLAGTDMTCAEWEENLSGEYSEVKCRANN